MRNVSFFYWSLRNYVRTALWFFYRTWQVEGRHHIPENAAVIFVANHQNAFQDALVVTCSIRHAPWFLTRAGVFSSKVARFIFRELHMMPVYRFRDGIKGLRNNEQSMRLSADLLNKRRAILLFGEGDQNMQWTLRAMQKGFARIAWSVQQENSWTLPLFIVPVGIQYDHYFDFRSRVLVNFGPAIPVDESYRTLAEREFHEAIVTQVRAAVRPLMLDIPVENYHAIETVIKHDRSKRDLKEQLTHDQHIAGTWNAYPVTVKPVKKNNVLLALTLPWHVYVWINNFIPYLLIHRILNKSVSREFRGSVKFGMGMVLVPLVYIVQSIGMHQVFHDWRITLVYFVTLPFLTAWSVDVWNKGTGKV